jgi:uncharacterized DUF497 family protein
LIFRFFIAKNLENIRKHQIDFADVPAMFDGEMLIERDDHFDYRENRWFGIGFLGSGIARTSKQCNPNHFSAKSQPS